MTLATWTNETVGWRFDLVALAVILPLVLLFTPSIIRYLDACDTEEEREESMASGVVDYRSPERDQRVLNVYDWESDGL